MGDFFLGKLEQLNGTPAKAKALFGGLEVSQAWVLVCGGCVSWVYGLAGCGILVKASLVSGRDLAAYLLSLVSIWRTLLSQGDELSWFFWIVVFLSVWVIYTTSA